MYGKIVKEIQDHVTQLFEKKSNKNLAFHSLAHTQYVVDKAKEISNHYGLREKQMAILLIAAWFHDTGYLFIGQQQHERISAEIMRKFMAELTNDNELISEIEHCILATKIPTNPKNILEQIICDADTYHFGTQKFIITNKQFMEEVKLTTLSFDKALFDKQTLNMLVSHKYYTP